MFNLVAFIEQTVWSDWESLGEKRLIKGYFQEQLSYVLWDTSAPRSGLCAVFFFLFFKVYYCNFETIATPGNRKHSVNILID